MFFPGFDSSSLWLNIISIQWLRMFVDNRMTKGVVSFILFFFQKCKGNIRTNLAHRWLGRDHNAIWPTCYYHPFFCWVSLPGHYVFTASISQGSTIKRYKAVGCLFYLVLNTFPIPQFPKKLPQQVNCFLKLSASKFYLQILYWRTPFALKVGSKSGSCSRK